MAIDVRAFPPQMQKQILAKLSAEVQTGKQKENKYHNVKDSRGEIRFDSKREAARFDELMMLQQAGVIRNLKLQHDFTLQEAYTTPQGERIRAIRYKADFSYETQKDAEKTRWTLVVEDVKSKPTRTKDYAMKRKMFREKYGFSITEVE